jgi:hypothetical protein
MRREHAPSMVPLALWTNVRRNCSNLAEAHPQGNGTSEGIPWNVWKDIPWKSTSWEWLLGLNVSMSTYLSYCNVYGAAFSQYVLGWMAICIALSGTATVVLQHYVDAWFDARNAKCAYILRINNGLLAAMFTLFMIPFVTHEWQVYSLGIICGIFEGIAISSMNQLAAAIHPKITKHANTGLTIGPAVPALLSAALGFHKSNTPFSTKVMYAWLPSIFPAIASVMFLVGTYRYEGFREAFERIQFRASNGTSTGTEEHQQTHTASEEDQKREEDSLYPRSRSNSSASGGSASWSWFQTDFIMCGVVQFFTNFLTRGSTPFLAYFGDFQLAHLLVLNSFVSELVGRLAAHIVTIKRMGCGMRDGIVILVILLIIRILFAVILILWMFKRFDLGTSSLHILVGMFYMIFGWMGNEIQVIIVEIVPKEQRDIVMRGMVFFDFGGKTLKALQLPRRGQRESVISYVLKGAPATGTAPQSKRGATAG